MWAERYLLQEAPKVAPSPRQKSLQNTAGAVGHFRPNRCRAAAKPAAKKTPNQSPHRWAGSLKLPPSSDKPKAQNKRSRKKNRTKLVCKSSTKTGKANEPNRAATRKRPSIMNVATLLIITSFAGQILGFCGAKLVSSKFPARHLQYRCLLYGFIIPDLFFFTISAGALAWPLMPSLSDRLYKQGKNRFGSCLVVS